MSGSAGDDAMLLASLEDTGLYSIGAYFSDRHPELVDDVLAQSAEIEVEGLARWAAREHVRLESAYQTLMTGLAVRYFKAVAASGP